MGWYLDRHRNFKRIFVPHRVAFEDWIKRHRAEQRRDQPKIDLFEEQYRKLLGDFHETGPTFPAHGSKPREVDVPEDTYLLVSDYLTHHGVNRARRHKALFCQNTAVALLFYAVVILDRRFRLSLLTPDPDTVLAHLIHQDVIHPAWPLPVGLLLASLVFLYATGVYKEFYLEYLIVDFVHSYNEAGGTAGPDGAD